MEKFSIHQESIKPKEEKPSRFEELRKKFGNNLYITLVVIASFVASPKESKAQDSKNIMHAIEIKDSIQENNGEVEFQKQKESLINWITNRIISDNKFEGKFEKIREDMLGRLNNVTLSKMSESSESWGSAEWRNDTVFYRDEVLSKPKLQSAFTHELTHQNFYGNYGSKPGTKFHTTMPKWMFEMITYSVKRSGDDNLSNMGFFKKYFERPEEIYARICALRFKYDLKPNQIVSKEILAEIILNDKKGDKPDDNIESLLMTITDPDSLLTLLNDLP